MLSFSINLIAQQKENNASINNYIKSLYAVEGEKIESSYLENLSGFDFIRVKWITDYDNNGAYDEKILCKKGDSWNVISEPSDLLQALNADIILENESDVIEFNKLLDLFFDFFGQGETTVSQKENNWYLIKADWFGTKSGFVITIDDNGVVINIEKSEEIEL